MTQPATDNAGGGTIAAASSPASSPKHPASGRALVVVDVQNDFCEGGALGVTGGTRVADSICLFLREHHTAYDTIAATQDWHRDPGDHFSSPPAEPNFQTTWPVHCVAGTPGAEIHPALADTLSAVAHAVVTKGEYTAAYSGFEGTTEDGTPLAEVLRQRGIGAIDVVGIATDHCVRATALDGVAEGFTTTVLTDLTAGVAPDSTRAALDELAAAGVLLR